MNVREIIKKHLEDNGFDGLYNTDGECACLKDDLLPCQDDSQECEPGYKGPCNGSFCDGDCGFHISRDKPNPND